MTGSTSRPTTVHVHRAAASPGRKRVRRGGRLAKMTRTNWRDPTLRPCRARGKTRRSCRGKQAKTRARTRVKPKATAKVRASRANQAS